MKPLYPEHKMYPELPDTIYICGRCKRQVMVFLGEGDGSIYTPGELRPKGWCYTCGESEGYVEYHKA